MSKDPFKQQIKDLEKEMKKLGKGKKAKIPKMPKPKKLRRAV